MNTYAEYGINKTEKHTALVLLGLAAYVGVLAWGVYCLYHIFPDAAPWFTVALIIFGWGLLSFFFAYDENKNTIALVCAVACIPIVTYLMYMYKDYVLDSWGYKDYFSDIYKYELVNDSYVVGPDGNRADGWKITLESNDDVVEEFTEYTANKGDIMQFIVRVKAPFEITDPTYDAEDSSETLRRTALWVHDQLGPEVRFQGYASVFDEDGKQYNVKIDFKLEEIHPFWDVFLSDISSEPRDDFGVYKYIGRNVGNMMSTVETDVDTSLTDDYYITWFDDAIGIYGYDEFCGFDANYLYVSHEPSVIDEVDVMIICSDETKATNTFNTVCRRARSAFGSPQVEEDDEWMADSDKAHVSIKKEYDARNGSYFVAVHMTEPMN